MYSKSSNLWCPISEEILQLKQLKALSLATREQQVSHGASRSKHLPVVKQTDSRENELSAVVESSSGAMVSKRKTNETESIAAKKSKAADSSPWHVLIGQYFSPTCSLIRFLIRGTTCWVLVPLTEPCDWIKNLMKWKHYIQSIHSSCVTSNVN